MNDEDGIKEEIRKMNEKIKKEIERVRRIRGFLTDKEGMEAILKSLLEEDHENRRSKED